MRVEYTGWNTVVSTQVSRDIRFGWQIDFLLNTFCWYNGIGWKRKMQYFV